MTHLPRTLLTLLLVSLAALPAGAARAAAPELSVTTAQRAGAGLEPVSFFDITARPGRTTAAGRIVVANGDDRPVLVDIDRVDAQTATNLGSAYDVRTSGLTAATRWTRLSRSRLRLAPGARAAIDVSVELPAGQSPGDYLSGVAIEARGQRENPGAERRVAIVSAQRYVVGLQVGVPGPRTPALRLGEPRVERLPAGVTFLLPMRNAGNAILTGVRGRIEVIRDGRRVVSQPVGPGTFVTGTDIDFPVPATGETPPAGTRYRVTATVRYAGQVATLDDVVTFGAREAERQEQYGGPARPGGRSWLWPALAAAALLLAIALLLAARRRVRLKSRASGLRLIERELAALGTGDRPLSVAVIGPVPGDRAKRRRVAREIQGRMRPTDTLCELSDDELLLIARDTGERAALALSDDLERRLANGGPPIKVTARTATGPATPAELTGGRIAAAGS
jgi:hypothetical protein